MLYGQNICTRLPTGGDTSPIDVVLDSGLFSLRLFMRATSSCQNSPLPGIALPSSTRYTGGMRSLVPLNGVFGRSATATSVMREGLSIIVDAVFDAE